MTYHPDVLAAHAEFGGNLDAMQALYDRPDHIARIADLERQLSGMKEWQEKAVRAVTDLMAECIRLTEALQKAEADVARMREALGPFAKIKPSTACAEDGSEAEPYRVFLAARDDFDFTGADLAAARAALEEQEQGR